MFTAQWWCLPLTRRQGQADLYEFELVSFTERIPEQPGLLREETLSQKNQKKEKVAHFHQIALGVSITHSRHLCHLVPVLQ